MRRTTRKLSILVVTAACLASVPALAERRGSDHIRVQPKPRAESESVTIARTLNITRAQAQQLQALRLGVHVPEPDAKVVELFRKELEEPYDAKGRTRLGQRLLDNVQASHTAAPSQGAYVRLSRAEEHARAGNPAFSGTPALKPPSKSFSLVDALLSLVRRVFPEDSRPREVLGAALRPTTVASRRKALLEKLVAAYKGGVEPHDVVGHALEATRALLRSPATPAKDFDPLPISQLVIPDLSGPKESDKIIESLVAKERQVSSTMFGLLVTMNNAGYSRARENELNMQRALPIFREAAKEPTPARQLAFLMRTASLLEASIVADHSGVARVLRSYVAAELRRPEVAQAVARQTLARRAPEQPTRARPSTYLTVKSRGEGMAGLKETLDTAWGILERTIDPQVLARMPKLTIEAYGYGINENTAWTTGRMQVGTNLTVARALDLYGWVLGHATNITGTHPERNPEKLGLAVFESEATLKAAFEKNPLTILALLKALQGR